MVLLSVLTIRSAFVALVRLVNYIIDKVMSKRLYIRHRPFGAYRSDGVAFYPISRHVYLSFFCHLFGCSLERCKFPTITCDKCSFAYE